MGRQEIPIMKKGNRITLAVGFFLITVVLLVSPRSTEALPGPSCESVVHELSGKLPVAINEAELVGALRVLNQTGNRQLPAQFVTKKEARSAGWQPGRSLGEVPELRGKSLGGDRFGNYEKKLPDGRRKWREADLDYRGGRRGPKRLIFSTDGLRVVTVDHYQTFREVPPCQ
jgi:ribonuclease T1